MAVYAGRCGGGRAGRMEYLGLAENTGTRPPRIAVLAAILALFAGYFEWPGQTAAILSILSLALLVYCTFFRPVEKLMADASSLSSACFTSDSR